MSKCDYCMFQDQFMCTAKVLHPIKENDQICEDFFLDFGRCSQEQKKSIQCKFIAECQRR